MYKGGFRLLTVLFIKGGVNVAQILQSLSYKVCPTTSDKFTHLDNLFKTFGPSLYTSSLLPCYENMRDSSTHRVDLAFLQTEISGVGYF